MTARELELLRSDIVKLALNVRDLMNVVEKYRQEHDFRTERGACCCEICDEARKAAR